MPKSYSYKSFLRRHIGSSEQETNEMLKEIGVSSLNQLIEETVPQQIKLEKELSLDNPMTEKEFLDYIHSVAQKNKIAKSYIGMGYYPTITPAVIQRNILENPGWYTQYTPYQAEISQGRLEALLNFQTMVSDLTGLPIANASLLDEATSAAESMLMFFHSGNNSAKNKFFVDEKVFPQTLDVLLNRANPNGIEITDGDFNKINLDETYFGALLQYPNSDGAVINYESFITTAHQKNIKVVVAADLLSLALLKAPGEFGADVAVGTTQRFGVPMGFGGPSAAYFAVKEEFKRILPGRIIGVSVDADGNPALRMALQTREQHIRREKATSNICTSQVLLAVMAGMYAVYHGPEGVRDIAETIHLLTAKLESSLQELSFEQTNKFFFDTLLINVKDEKTIKKVKSLAENKLVNFHYVEKNKIGISLSEVTTEKDVLEIVEIFAEAIGKKSNALSQNLLKKYPAELERTSSYLQHPIFNSFHSETELMRYAKRLENKDISLTYGMIPLGSCTMKLNAAAEMLGITHPGFTNIHPFAPQSQTEGYQIVVSELEKALAEITGFAGTSLQPNSGAQGEYSGLMVIRQYYIDKNESHRNIALIPSSAHGTNPASAVMAGMKVVVVACDEKGNVDVDDLKKKAEEHKNDLAALMITYPSTHGVFEVRIKEICEIIHANGGQVYMDGANMNAQVGLTSPKSIGADVCHLNLHKTFAIPHGGGGPGVGPICVAKHLVPFLPKHSVVSVGGEKGIHAVSASPYGSANVLIISYGYIKMLGAEGLKTSTEYAILNANYIAAKLKPYYKILYTGEKGRVAHEMIFDMRDFKRTANIEVEDIGKRLMDYGFHAPTISFPVHGTMMIEPTESESKKELDRFCEAMILIKKEMDAIENGSTDKEDNVIKNAPHTMHAVSATEWKHKYSREEGAFPSSWVKQYKFWPATAKVNNGFGDRNLVCTCPSVEEYK
ncbi:MAG: aminomethyl-transferring glycine dehydrogenase [Ignavibacteriaceae bacterium]|jgi:glycine dehydrogenase